MTASVLIVDDSSLARKMLVRALPPAWNVEVTQAGGGAEALVAYRAGKFDVMFLDLTMPDVDGYQVLEALKSEGPLKCKIIVVSADIQPLARQRVLGLGAIAFLQKPLGAPELEAALREYRILI